MMDSILINNIVLVLIDVLGFWLALWVYLADRSKKVNFGLFLMIITIISWITFYHFGFYSKDKEISLLLFKFAGASVFIFFIAYYFFIVRWFLGWKGIYKVLGKVVIVYSSIFAFLTILTDWIISTSKIEEWGSFPVFSNWGWFIFYGYVFFITIVIIGTLLADYSQASEVKKRKIVYFLIGIFIFTVLNLIFNVFFQVLFSNYALYQVGNYSAIFLIGFTLYAIVRHELFDIKVIAAKVLSVLLWVVLFVTFLLSETEMEFLINGAVLFFVAIFGVLLIRSVEKEVQQKEELEKLTERLKFLDKQKDEFVSMAAHELRAPMTAIKGYLSMVLEGDAGEIPSKARGYLADASSITDRLTRLVNNMLNVSRIEEGRLAYQIEVISLSRVAQMVYNQFKIEAERKGLDIQLDIQNNLNDRVKVDVDKIQEVMSNFASNAVKYTDEGKVVMRLKEGQEGWVRFEVEDTGPGISKDEQKKLFHKFYRAESNVGKTIGTGLGLYICKLLINNFEGRLGLVSNVGDGSLFWFELPLYDGKEGEVLSSGSSDNKDQSNNSN